MSLYKYVNYISTFTTVNLQLRLPSSRQLYDSQPLTPTGLQPTDCPGSFTTGLWTDSDLSDSDLLGPCRLPRQFSDWFTDSDPQAVVLRPSTPDSDFPGCSTAVVSRLRLAWV